MTAASKSRPTPRIVLHTGKGGVGKTTMSAATAIAAAQAGHRTLLLSTDPAHSVADVLGVDLSSDPLAIDGVDGLWAAQVDTRGSFEQAWSDIRGYLVGVLSARGIAQVEAEELTVLPGADEVVALLEVHRHASSGKFDVIVVDCAPSGESLKLLALPETIRFYGERLMGAPARLMRTLAAGFAGLGARSPGTPSAAEISDSLGGLLENLTAARELLADNSVTGIRLVVTPERVVIAEARRLLTAFALHGFAVESVLVNRVLPDNLEGGGFLTAWRVAQSACFLSITESFGRLRIHQATLTAEEPVGLERLQAVALQLFGGLDPVADPVPSADLRTEGSDGHYRLRLNLPLAERGEVDLSRAGDDLVVTVGPNRRRIALPSLLQRCRTTGARFEVDALIVEFEADPDRWPGALSASLDAADLAGTG